MAAISTRSNADISYDVDIAIKNILDYIKHLIRDVQQKEEAKKWCFDHVNAGWPLKFEIEFP